MISSCGADEDSWESLGQQGDQTSQSQKKPTLNIHWKGWGWIWNANTLPTWCESWLVGKDPDAGKIWRKQENKATEDEMARQHHLTKSKDMNLSKLQETVKDRGSWHGVVHGITKSRTWFSDWTSITGKKKKTVGEK